MGQNPATVKAAEFTDAQILDLLSQAKAAGLGVEQAEKLALAKGMPASEAQAFKDRLNKVQAKAPSNAATPALASEETAEASKRAEEINQLKQELAQKEMENAKIKAETDAKLAQMQEQMAAILAAVGEKKTRTRKPKVVEEA